MASFKCVECDYSTNYKSNFIKHTKTKKHRDRCKKKSISEEILTPMTQNDPKMTQNDPQMTQNDPAMTQNDPQMTPKSIKFYCDYCEKGFTTKAHKRRHEIHRCKENNHNIYKIITTQEAKIKILEKEKQELYEKLDELIKKVGDTNIQNNIIINSYGKEDLSHITDKIKDQLLKIPYCSIPKLIETIHFNDDMPQNKNIKYPNKKENILSVYEGDKWVYKDKNKTINDLIDSKYNVLDDHFDSTNSELPNFVKHSYSSFKKVYEEGDEDFVKNLKKECDMVLLNNRK